MNTIQFHAVKDRTTLHQDCEQWLSTAPASIATHIESSAFFKSLLPYGHEARSLMVLHNSAAALADLFKSSPAVTHTEIACRPHFIALTQQVFGENYERLTAANIPAVFRQLGLSPLSVDEAVASTPERADIIRRKIADDCCICFERPAARIMFPCCASTYCGVCGLRQAMTQGTCPVCRSHIHVSGILYVPAEGHIEAPLPSKREACIQYIGANQGGRFIVFITHENIFYDTHSRLSDMGIRAEFAKSGRTLQAIIDRFAAGETQALFVSEPAVITGLNLTAATHLISFSGQPEVSCALRIGRTLPLAVVQLASEFG